MKPAAAQTDEPIFEATTLGFAARELKLDLYDWQIRALAPLDHCPRQRAKITVCTPNGAGKSERLVATAVLYWLAMFPKGKVVVTTKSGLQLDSQIEPAIRAHREKFPTWRFIERTVITPPLKGEGTGGLCVMFTTDEAGRAEGHHTVDNLEVGPVLIIVDEAKSVSEEIFEALDRCTWTAMMYVSSPGKKVGRFYKSHFDESLGFTRVRVGLKDCPHIPRERVADIIKTYGRNHPFTRSTLDGEFMEAEGEARFDLSGLDFLEEQAAVEDAEPTAEIGSIIEQSGGRDEDLAFAQDSAGWLWLGERPKPGFSYLAFCDPMTGEQSEGSKIRDCHAAGIIKAPCMTNEGGKMVEHDAEVVAVLHHPGGCRWHNDILAGRLDLVTRFFGDPMIICEANNSGSEVMRLLVMAGRRLWRREKPNHRIPGKKMLDVVGFQTTASTKNLWIGALSTCISDHSLLCRYRLAVDHMKTFILDENGRGAAQEGCHDDFVTGIGLGLFAIRYAAPMPERNPLMFAAAGGGQGSYTIGPKAGPWS